MGRVKQHLLPLFLVQHYFGHSTTLGGHHEGGQADWAGPNDDRAHSSLAFSVIVEKGLGGHKARHHDG